MRKNKLDASNIIINYISVIVIIIIFYLFLISILVSISIVIFTSEKS